MTQNQMKSRGMYLGQTSAYTTAATVTEELPRLQTFTPTREWRKVEDFGLGEGNKAIQSHLSQYVCGGRLSFRVTPTGLDFLKHWIGPKSGAGSSGDPYVLTEADFFSLSGSSGIQVFSYSDANATSGEVTDVTYVGCVGNSFTLSGSMGGFLVCDADFIGRHTVDDTSAPSYTAVTDNALTMINSTVKWGSTPSAISNVERFSITYSNAVNRDDYYSIESPFIVKPTPGLQTYQFDFDIKMAQSLATTIINEFYAASGQPEDGSTTTVSPADNEFKIELVNGANSCNLWLDQAHIKRIVDVKQVGGGLVILRVQGVALYGGNTNKPISWWSS